MKEDQSVEHLHEGCRSHDRAGADHRRDLLHLCRRFAGDAQEAVEALDQPRQRGSVKQVELPTSGAISSIPRPERPRSARRDQFALLDRSDPRPARMRPGSVWRAPRSRPSARPFPSPMDANALRPQGEDARPRGTAKRFARANSARPIHLRETTPTTIPSSSMTERSVVI